MAESTNNESTSQLQITQREGDKMDKNKDKDIQENIVEVSKGIFSLDMRNSLTKVKEPTT